MNLPLPAPGTPGQPGPVRNWPRRLANAAVAVAVIAVAGATFVLSYSGVRAVAITGGVSDHLARVYPGVFDAVLVIACVAAIMLRDARWWARAWAWLVVVVLLAAIGATDVVHAMGYTLRHRPTEGIVAAAPVAAVLLAFSLLLTLLRQSRTAGDATATRRAAKRPPDTLPAIAAGTAPRLPAPPIALPAAAGDPFRSEVAAAREEPAVGSAPEPLPAPAAEALPEPSPETLAEPAAETLSEPLPESSPEPEREPQLGPEPEPEPEPPTVELPEVFEVPADTPHAPTEASPVVSSENRWPAASPRMAPSAIRYASSAPDQPDYWDADDDRQFAGQVYPDPRAEEDPATSGFDSDSDDVPSHGTASPVPHGPSFSRVRSTPTPPADEDQ
jgi:hypothetical protein